MVVTTVSPVLVGTGRDGAGAAGTQQWRNNAPERVRHRRQGDTAAPPLPRGYAHRGDAECMALCRGRGVARAPAGGEGVRHPSNKPAPLQRRSASPKAPESARPTPAGIPDSREPTSPATDPSGTTAKVLGGFTEMDHTGYTPTDTVREQVSVRTRRTIRPSGQVRSARCGPHGLSSTWMAVIHSGRLLGEPKTAGYLVPTSSDDWRRYMTVVRKCSLKPCRSAVARGRQGR